MGFCNIYFGMLLFHIYFSKRYVYWSLKDTLWLYGTPETYTLYFMKKKVSRPSKEVTLLHGVSMCPLYNMQPKRKVFLSFQRTLLKIDNVQLSHVWDNCITIK